VKPTFSFFFVRFSVIQFYIKLGCDRIISSELVKEPILLQYSVDGGIHWTIVQQFDFSDDGGAKPSYIALATPVRAKTNSTRLQWQQTQLDGKQTISWAIDQVS